MPPNLLKPSLQSGELRCIGSTTYKDTATYSRRTARSSALSRRLTCRSPRSADAVEIMKGLSRSTRSTTTYLHRRGHQGSVELAARYIHDRKAADKSIDVIDEVRRRPDAAHPRQRKSTIDVHDIEEIVARSRASRPRACSKRHTEMLRNIDATSRRSCSARRRRSTTLGAIKLAAPACARQEKQSLLPAGRSDRVGKTEVTRQLGPPARPRAMPLRHVGVHGNAQRSRLIGAPPG